MLMPSLFLLLTTSFAVTAGQAELSDCRVDIDTNWTVGGSCHYTKADVSRIDDINCTWYRQHNQGSVTLVTDGIVTGQLITEGSKTYYSGNCSFSVDVSTSQMGNHIFYIDFVPGPGRVETGTLEIDEPGKPESNCEGRIVFPEGQDRSCTCTNSKSHPGSPPPSVGWRELAPGQPLLLRDIKRVPIESRWFCEMSWGPEGNSTVKTTNIITVIHYGPDSVRISDSANNPPLTDLLVGQTATWRCQAFTSNSPARIEWTGVVCDNGQTSTDCRFTAGSQDDGKTVTCTGRNNRFPDDLHTDTSVRLNIKYPPNVAPDITGYINNTELTEGDNLTLTCTVRGGNPPVSSVAFSCGTDHHDNPNDTVVNSALHNDSSVSSTVTILNLQAGDDGTTCVCEAEWSYRPVSLNYILTSSVTLKVNVTEVATTTIATTTRAQHQAPNNGDPKDSPLPIAAIAGGAAGGFAVIILIVVIVCVTTRKRRPQGKKPHVPTTEEDDFEEHENPIYGAEDDTAPLAQFTSSPPAVALRIPNHSDSIANSPSTHSNVYHTVSGNEEINEEYTTVGSTKPDWDPTTHADASVTKVTSAAVGSGAPSAGQQQQTLPHANNCLTTGSKSTAATKVSGTSGTTSSLNTSSGGHHAEAGSGMLAAQTEEKSSNSDDGLYCNTTEGDPSDTNPYENTTSTSTEHAALTKPKDQSLSAPSGDVCTAVDKPGVQTKQAQSADVYAVVDKPRNKPQPTTNGDVYAVVDKTTKQANGSTPGKASVGESRPRHDDSTIPPAKANKSENAVTSSQAAPTNSDARGLSTINDSASSTTNDIYAQVDQSAKKMDSPTDNTSATAEEERLARGQKPKMVKKPK